MRKQQDKMRREFKRTESKMIDMLKQQQAYI